MKQLRFRYLPHTADMEFVAYGRDLKEALESAAYALLNIILDLKAIDKEKGITKSVTIREKAKTFEDLAWFTLQDILSKRDTSSLNATSFKIKKIKGNKEISLSGQLLYKKIRGDYTMLDVKAVTPHDLKITRGKKDWSINVVVDV